MGKFIIAAVVNQQLAVAYLMVRKYEPNLSLEDFCKSYAETLKIKKGEIQIVIKQLNVKEKKKK